MIPAMRTSKALIFTWSDGTPRSVEKQHPNFDAISTLIGQSVSADFLGMQAVYAKLEQLLDVRAALRSILEHDEIELFLEEGTDRIVANIEGRTFVVPTDLAADLIELYNEDGNIDSMVKFLISLANNPDKDIAEQVWKFIKECGLCLADDGSFLAYKNVNGDFTSIHDGRTDNTPGTILQMPRNEVEKNPDRTCSHGLHFAAWGYLRHYSSRQNGKTVLVAVKPEDVVSIPSDYNNQKGRACKYKVIREVSSPLK